MQSKVINSASNYSISDNKLSIPCTSIYKEYNQQSKVLNYGAFICHSYIMHNNVNLWIATTQNQKNTDYAMLCYAMLYYADFTTRPYMLGFWETRVAFDKQNLDETLDDLKFSLIMIFVLKWVYLPAAALPSAVTDSSTSCSGGRVSPFWWASIASLTTSSTFSIVNRLAT